MLSASQIRPSEEKALQQTRNYTDNFENQMDSKLVMQNDGNSPKEAPSFPMDAIHAEWLQSFHSGSEAPYPNHRSWPPSPAGHGSLVLVKCGFRALLQWPQTSSRSAVVSATLVGLEGPGVARNKMTVTPKSKRPCGIVVAECGRPIANIL